MNRRHLPRQLLFGAAGISLLLVAACSSSRVAQTKPVPPDQATGVPPIKRSTPPWDLRTDFVDARWSEFAGYLDGFVGAVDANWQRIIGESKGRRWQSNHVLVDLRLKANGEVAIERVDSFGDSFAVDQARKAVSSVGRQTRWSDRMVAALGTEQSIGLSFYCTAPAPGPIEHPSPLVEWDSARPRGGHGETRAAPLNSLVDRANTGITGINGSWSEYGDYMNELVAIVDHEWHGIVDGSNRHSKPNSHVEVTFTLNAKGEVRIKSVENFAGEAQVKECIKGITNPAPYRKWTDKMIASLGQEQTITFGFYYY